MNNLRSGSRFFVSMLLGVLMLSIGASASASTSASQKMTEAQMPKGLWQAFSEARHAVEPSKDLKEGYAYKAYNPKNQYGIRYGEQGLKLQNSDWKFGMSLKAYGQASTLTPVSKATLHTKGNKVTYDRGNISEWYINDTKGLEQGFTLNKPKNYDVNKELILSLDLKGGLTPKWKTKGESLTFYKKNVKAFDYEKLKAFDAKGKVLPSRLALKENTLQILVDAKDAQWPVTVDPIFATEQRISYGGYFGFSVALKGDTALVGAPEDSTGATESGAAYVFTNLDGIWTLQTKFVNPEPAEKDGFGLSVALDGDTALIGLTQDDDTNNGLLNSGSVYVYTRLGTTWTLQQKLTASDAATNDSFGVNVALEGDTALVGAWYDDDNGSGSGSAYVFSRSEGVWTQQQKLTASDASADDYFGISVALEDDTALVAAHHQGNGSVYVFINSSGNWTEQAKLTAPDAEGVDYFGDDVTLSGDTALIGCPGDDHNGAESGSAYVFTRSGTTWTFEAKLIAPDYAADARFGTSVALEGNTAVITAYRDSNWRGAAYVFTRSGVNWWNIAKLHTDEYAIDTFFGRGRDSASLYGDTALVGAHGVWRADAAYFKRFECGFAGPIIANKWTMLGLPCTPDSNADTVGELFGDTLDVNDYYARWIVYRYDASTESYEQLTVTDPVSQGEGYWLLSYDDAYWDATGSLTTYPVTQAEGCAVAEGCYAIDLVLPDSETTRHNLVGFPNNIDIDWSQARFVLEDGTSYTPSQAETNNIASKTMWKWNGSSYDTYDDSTPGMLGTLSSHEGLWVQMLSGAFSETSVKLLIPAKDSLAASEASDAILAQIGAEADSGDVVNSIVTVVQLGKILPLLTDIYTANEILYQDYIDANPDLFSGPATQAEVQSMIYIVNANQLQENISIDNAALQKAIGSIIDTTPYAIDVQGVIDANRLKVTIPYTVVNAPTTLLAYSTSVLLDSSVTEDGEMGITASFAWEQQTNLPVGSGSFTATISIDDSSASIPDGTYNAKKLDIQDNIAGVMAATFPYPTNFVGGMGTLTLKIYPGIPDRMFGTVDNTSNANNHMFLYLPVTNPTTVKTWLNNNLGANYANINSSAFDHTQQALASNDHHAYGSLFQWGRKADGHELINWSDGSTGTPVNGMTSTKSDEPDHALFITTVAGGDWRVTGDATLWENEASNNNVCPRGYRVATQEELELERLSWSSNDITGALASPNAMSAPGYIHSSTGVIDREGTYGYYWSSTYDSSTQSKALRFLSGSASTGGYGRSAGFTVRCIKDVTEMIINDNFDAETVGTLPSGWVIKYNGTGDANQKVVDTHYTSPNHSFQLEGSSWGANIYKVPSSIPNNVTIESNIYIDKIVSDYAGFIVLRNKDTGSWGTTIGGLRYEDGKFIAYNNDGSLGYEISNYTPQQWYHVKIVYDTGAKTYQIYIDGALASGTNDGVNYYTTFPMHQTLGVASDTVLMLAAGNGDTVKVFYDDVKMYEP